MNLFDQPHKEKQIKEAKPGDRIMNAFKVLSLQKRTKKNGEPFLALELMDKTGKISGKIWENVDRSISLLKAGEIYKIKGTITEYQSKKEIKIESLNPVGANDRDVDRSDFQERPPFDVEKSYREMMDILKSSVSNPYLIQLIQTFSEKYGGVFKTHYGALKIHHAYAGGLLEHTLSVIKLAITLADMYDLDKEVMAVGALFHDLGKLKETTQDPPVGITREGGLIGHIVLGNEIFLDCQKQVSDFPPDLGMKIQHLIVSHHGEQEFGSPEVPKTKEAFALHIIDMLDSKLNIFQDIIDQTDPAGPFSDFSRLLGRRVYIPENRGDGDQEDGSPESG